MIITNDVGKNALSKWTKGYWYILGIPFDEGIGWLVLYRRSAWYSLSNGQWQGLFTNDGNDPRLA